ncbi:MAG: diguanylate cyclase [Lachnospiraceae bacterium]|nr:diguanylate cyclase [Lachnospiraceae bacterium]
MKIDSLAFNQIAMTLAGHFDSLFYVDMESGWYTEFIPTRLFGELHIPREGNDFFAMFRENAPKCVHPNDLKLILHLHEKKMVLEKLSKNHSFSVSCRIVMNGKTMHVRHINVLCEDQRHVLFCMENIDDEVQKKEEQRKILLSAERKARVDELTGIKNKNAFAECTRAIDRRIQAVEKELCFGVVMCDVNDLKRFNDTRGHSFGDEVLRRASRMLSAIFQNSQMFRIGGDEFAIVLMGEDYEIREELLESLRKESYANGRMRSGPVIASGMAVFEPARDTRFADVFGRADSQMYENKKLLKSGSSGKGISNATVMEIPVPEARKRKLDGLFGALFTAAGEGYVFLNDLRYDYSRWALSLVDDFGLPSEYMYHAGKQWQQFVHPDDLAQYRKVVDAVVNGKSEMKYLCYRARRPDGTYVWLKPRAFILNDDQGNPEYFGGIIIPQ